MDNEPSVGTYFFFWLLGAAGWLTFSHWAAVWLGALFTGRDFTASPQHAVSATIDLIFRRAPANEAWGQEVASAWLLWPFFVVVAAGTSVVLFICYHVMFAKKWGIKDRKVLGVDAEAAFAGKHDLIGLEAKMPLEGRFLLGEYNGRTLATESSSEAAKSLRSVLHSPRTYGRGAVAIIGPSQCGKTSALLAAIMEWDGPAMLVSVKDDLFGALPERRRRGPTAIFDPTGRMADAYAFQAKEGTAGKNKRPSLFGKLLVALRLKKRWFFQEGYDARMLGGWSPLMHAHTFNGAEKAADHLVAARPDAGGSEERDIWSEMAGTLVAGYLYVAANTKGVDMEHVVRWIKLQDGNPEFGTGVVPGMLDDLEARIHEQGSGITFGDVDRARTALEGIWHGAAPTTKSVYIQAQTLVKGWSTEQACASTRTNLIDLEWLMDMSEGPRTVFCTAPPADMKRLSSVFGGFINDILDQAFDYNLYHPEGFEKPLLLVIDEASKVPLQDLADYASTVAGLGVQLVTVWQTQHQIDKRYGQAGAGELLSNHITKLVFPGLEGKDVEYVAKIIGEHYDTTNTEMSDMYKFHRGSMQTGESVRNLAPGHTLRQMEKDTALLVHGALPPAQINVLSCYDHTGLRKRLKWDKRGDQDIGIPAWGRVVKKVSMFAGLATSNVSMTERFGKEGL